MKTRVLLIALSMLLGAALTRAQSGGGYDLSHNVISGGGEMRSAGGNFEVGGTIGQAIAGTTSNGGIYGLHGGFWFPVALAPTAANVMLTGRVLDLNGGNVRRVRVVLTDTTSGEIRTAQTNPFGYYRFDGVEVGRVYIVRAESRVFQFTPDSYVFSLVDARDDLDFTVIETR